jgi:hypothetical protein
MVSQRGHIFGRRHRQWLVVYDADTGMYSQISIATAGNLRFAYTNHVASLPYALDVNTGSTAVGQGLLQLVTVSSLTNAGGTIAIGRHPVDQFMYSWESLYVPFNGGTSHGPVVREVVAGVVTSVPALTLSQ